MKLNFRRKKAPTVADLESDQQQVVNLRAQQQAALKDVDDNMDAALAAGDDARWEELSKERAAIEAKLASLSRVSGELERERQEAIRRELVAIVRAEYEEMAALAKEITDLNPKVREAEQTYVELLDQNNAKRERYGRLSRDTVLRLRARVQAAGNDPAIVNEIGPELDALRMEFADTLNCDIADTYDIAAATVQQVPSRAHRESGLVDRKAK